MPKRIAFETNDQWMARKNDSRIKILESQLENFAQRLKKLENRKR